MKMQTEIVNTIKLLIYKENSLLLEKLDFDDDNVFLEPLLFTYFNLKKVHQFSSDILEEILQGYFIKENVTFINYSFNKQNIAYVPNVGYFKKGEKIPFDFIKIIKDTEIEIIKHPISILYHVFKNHAGEIITPDKIIIDNNIFEKNITKLSSAFQLIKENSSDHFKLIKKHIKKVLMFKTEPENINSFASIHAHGIAFLNVYQDDYDVVFFVDDIAHQTGHLILTTLFHDRKAIFKINEEQTIGEILLKEDKRSIYILIHAFYTYYTTFLCLDDCIRNNSFDKKQENEAIGRIGFYLNKCSRDFENFRKIIIHFEHIENILTSQGIDLLNVIKEKYVEMYKRWDPVIKKFDYSNQPYNFTYSKFIELN